MKMIDLAVMLFETEGGAAGEAGGGAAAGGQPGEGAAGAGSSGAAGEGQAGQTGGQAGGAASEPEHEVTVAGQKVKVKLSELVSGYSRQQDYTRKTQELAEQRKKLESDYQSKLRTELARLLDEEKRRGAGGGEQEEKDPIAETQAQVKRLEQKMMDDKLDAILSSLESKHQGLDRQALLIRAAREGVQNLEDLPALAQALMEETEKSFSERFEKVLADENHPMTKKWAQKIVDAYVARKAKESKSKAGETGGGGAPGGEGPKAPKNSDETRRMVEEALNTLG